jgi:hypothetical protein
MKCKDEKYTEGELVDIERMADSLDVLPREREAHDGWWPWPWSPAQRELATHALREFCARARANGMAATAPAPIPPTMAALPPKVPRKRAAGKSAS